LTRCVKHRIHSLVRHLRESKVHLGLRFGRKISLNTGTVGDDVVVSLTSFPARINNAWLAIESIFQQTIQPNRIVLVLAEDEFPERKIPRHLSKQVGRGLEILWTEINYRSYDKLLPVLRRFPNSIVITVDDDKILPTNLVADLLDDAKNFPGSIVGYRGWELTARNGSVEFGKGWQRASPQSPPDRVFLPGNGGILYPPQSLHPAVYDIEAAMRIAPSSDDIWFWACSVKNGTPRRCLGGPPHISIHGQDRTPALKNVNITNDQVHFESVVDFFDLRKWLLTIATN